MPTTEEGKELVNFESLQLEEGDTPSRSVQLLALLKDNLSPEKLGEAKKILGLEEEMSNSELLAEIQKLLEKKEAQPAEKEGDGSDYKAFMKACMAEGKDLKTCSAEYKEKYPTAAEPSEEDRQELEQLEKKKPEDEYPEPIKKKMQELENEIANLKALNRNEGIDSRVDALVEAKHLAPRQAVEVKKLMKTLPDEQHASILGIFQAQQLTVNKDVGKQAPPGRNEMTPDERKAILKDFGLDTLMKQKGGKLPGVD